MRSKPVPSPACIELRMCAYKDMMMYVKELIGNMSQPRRSALACGAVPSANAAHP